jgi:excisionase family DNA binding protein
MTQHFKTLAVRRKVAAQALGIGVSKIDLLIANGTINAVKSGKCLLIPTSELERYFAELPKATLNIASGKRGKVASKEPE